MSRELVWKHSLKFHKKIKPQILNFISQYEQLGECPDAVTKTDYYDPTKDHFPPYWNLFADNADDLLECICNKYWAQNFNVASVWFQQYQNNDFHGWHLHGNSSISMSYLLELDDYRHSTEFIDIERNDTFQLEVEEGDVIIFPSYIIHRSPLIRSNNRKTTIAVNINLGTTNQRNIDRIDPILKSNFQNK